ncbi:hypothetical protein AWC38_SpisGene11702 [Stylophora pistillata]|uniref:Uncharacterized protein n=1 Tax=Stylophora pistillata TaxID=50429 RepID=A0A2B4S4L9_STYPI|nr:hypothetical protein AWC38_SpisGene11702 [Stylophora pistillata]
MDSNCEDRLENWKLQGSSNHSTLSDSNPFAKDNCGYHKSGPQATMEIENKQSVEAMGGEPIPAIAMVDKSKKKDKKKNKEAAEQKLSEDKDAVVDKSEKKKKKNEQDNTYAEVDMSRISKKKQKPGEVLYADLDEFQQMQKMPKGSTSPEPLPPIKRPEAYDETQYADITQFLKGNPDTGAELPKDDTTPAVSNTVTGRKEESSVRNTVIAIDDKWICVADTEERPLD